MTAPQNRPWPALSPIRRFGPIALVVALVAGAGVVATVKGRSGADGGTPGGAPKAPTQDVARTYAKNPRLPVLYRAAKKAGTLDRYDWGSHCDPKTGRLAIPSIYAPPCVPKWKGAKPWVDKGGKTITSNGGETAPGVTANTITVAVYKPSPQDITAQLQAFGVLDTPEVAAKGVKDLVAAANGQYELYGRKVVVKPFQASGDGKTRATAQADARKVADDLGAFASIGGPTQTSAYQDELARRGVMCIGCGYATPDKQYQRDAPYAFGQLASPDQLVFGVFDFGSKNLFGKPARFAGDPAMRTKERVFGIVHYEQDPPVFGDLERRAIAKYEKEGYTAKINLTYLLDLPSLPNQAQAIVGKLKRAGVTSVVFLGDPLMPKYLTEQATKQDYHPEWIITGTVFTDSTAAGRLYDQDQWAHAFGASSLPARTKPQLSEPWRQYRWWYGKDPVAKKTLPLLGPTIQQFFIGLQLAGPHLQAKTFAGGLFSYPPSGGGPTTPRISFGFHGLFKDADYVGVDDFTNVFWDPKATGPDEQDKQGTGMWRYVGNGRRLLLGDVPEVDTDLLFSHPESAPTLLDKVPKEDRPPDYKPWKTSPAAQGEGG
ncbi:MAG: hypothetical protein ACR2MB_05475 [Acidimicrobiales bacterium]